MIWATVSRYTVAFAAGYMWATGASTATKVIITLALVACIIVDVIVEMHD